MNAEKRMKKFEIASFPRLSTARLDTWTHIHVLGFIPTEKTRIA